VFQAEGEHHRQALAISAHVRVSRPLGVAGIGDGFSDLWKLLVGSHQQIDKKLEGMPKTLLLLLKDLESSGNEFWQLRILPGE
jgi:hypothetical protein